MAERERDLEKHEKEHEKRVWKNFLICVEIEILAELLKRNFEICTCTIFKVYTNEIRGSSTFQVQHLTLSDAEAVRGSAAQRASFYKLCGCSEISELLKRRNPESRKGQKLWKELSYIFISIPHRATDKRNSRKRERFRKSRTKLPPPANTV